MKYLQQNDLTTLYTFQLGEGQGYFGVFINFHFFLCSWRQNPNLDIDLYSLKKKGQGPTEPYPFDLFWEEQLQNCSAAPNLCLRHRQNSFGGNTGNLVPKDLQQISIFQHIGKLGF